MLPSDEEIAEILSFDLSARGVMELSEHSAAAVNGISDDFDLPRQQADAKQPVAVKADAQKPQKSASTVQHEKALLEQTSFVDPRERPPATGCCVLQ